MENSLSHRKIACGKCIAWPRRDGRKDYTKKTRAMFAMNRANFPGFFFFFFFGGGGFEDKLSEVSYQKVDHENVC